LHNYESSSELDSSGRKKHVKKISQPIMKYKPRSDLQRIIETINSNAFHKVDNKVLENHLKNLDKKQHNDIQEKNPDNMIFFETAPNERDVKRDQIDDMYEDDSTTSEGKKFKNEKFVRRNLNTEAKYILNEYTIKTHFKGAASLSLKKIKDIKYDDYFESDFSKKNKNNNFSRGILTEPKDKLDEQLIKEHESLFQEDEKTQKIEQLNYLNPHNKKNRITDETNREALEKLKEIYIEGEILKNECNKTKTRGFNKNLIMESNKSPGRINSWCIGINTYYFYLFR